MQLGLHASMCDWTTKRIADVLHAPFKAIGEELSKEYGGSMEHLWIDFELIEALAQHRPPYLTFILRTVSANKAHSLDGGMPVLFHTALLWPAASDEHR